MKRQVKITKRENGTLRVQQCFPDESLTQQHFKDECNVHKILEKHKRTGVMSVNKGYQNPIFGDFSNPVDYREACDVMIQAENQFLALPAAIRERFGNDPERFLEFASDPENRPEMIKMGLIEPDVKETQPVPSTQKKAVKTAENEPQANNSEAANKKSTSTEEK